ncbi:azurin [Lysobacter panacisoli]
MKHPGAVVKKYPVPFVFIALFGAAGLAHANGCTVPLKSNDAMNYDRTEATVSASCATITLELVHAGKMPAAAMGHNVVITAAADREGVARDAIKAGAANHYAPKNDARVIAATTVIGGGGKTSVTFPGNKLTPGADYTFFCSFPGHAMLMKGKLVVTK